MRMSTNGTIHDEYGSMYSDKVEFLSIDDMDGHTEMVDKRTMRRYSTMLIGAVIIVVGYGQFFVIPRYYFGIVPFHLLFIITTLSYFMILASVVGGVIIMLHEIKLEVK